MCATADQSIGLGRQVAFEERSDFFDVMLKGLQVTVSCVGNDQCFGIGLGRGQFIEVCDRNDGVGVAVDNHDRCFDMANPNPRSKSDELIADHTLNRPKDEGEHRQWDVCHLPTHHVPGVRRC